MKVVAKFDSLGEWKEFCGENNLIVEDLGENDWVCFEDGSSELNPIGWYDEDTQTGEILWNWSMM